MPAHHLHHTPVYILDAVRTAVGSPFRSLKEKTAVDLGATVIDALLSRSLVPAVTVDEVVMGQTLSAGNGQNPARLAALLGKVSETTPAYTVNHVCAAGLQAVIQASRGLALGHARLAIAGGMESVTHAPHLFTKLDDRPFAEREPIDSLILDGLWCSVSAQHMGQLCEALAGQERISRLAQDRFAFQSHQKAQAAQQAGHFEKEIIPVLLKNGSCYEADERLRRVTFANIRSLPSVFDDRGTITSANASIPSDGAAAVMLSSASVLQSSRVKPLAQILAYALMAVKPQDVFAAGVPAVKACLKACGLKLKDIDLFEVAEAFAAQAIYTQQVLRIPDEKLNIWGGDIALGHPLGAAGARILVTLVRALEIVKGEYGLAVICMGGGGAVAVIIKRERS